MPARTGTTLRRTSLHQSLADPVLRSMAFLNDISSRYPDAVSFAAGRPHEGFYDVGQLHRYLDRYVTHLEDSGHSPERIRSALFQYGPTKGRINDLIATMLERDEDMRVAP